MKLDLSTGLHEQEMLLCSLKLKLRAPVVPDRRRVLSRSLYVKAEKTLAPSSLEFQKNPRGICSAWAMALCHYYSSLNFP